MMGVLEFFSESLLCDHLIKSYWLFLCEALFLYQYFSIFNCGDL